MRLQQTGPVDLTFGDSTTKVQSLLVADLSGESQSLGAEISGVLGFDVLSSADIKINFRDGLVIINNDKRHGS
jgi:hypothetical protein